MSRYCRFAVLSAALLLLSAGAVGQDDGFGKDFTGRVPPELIVSDNAWITAAEQELSLEKLRGRVVWLEFSFINCGGCIMMKPILQGLQRYHRTRPLTVIEVNNGEIDTREALAAQAELSPPNYALLWDKDAATCKAYGVRTYGSAYLIGHDGTVIWKGNPLDLSIPALTWKVTKALNDAEAAASSGG